MPGAAALAKEIVALEALTWSAARTILGRRRTMTLRIRNSTFDITFFSFFRGLTETKLIKDSSQQRSNNSDEFASITSTLC